MIMAGKNKNENSKSHLKKLKKYLVSGYVFIIVAVVIIISILTINKTDKALTSKVSNLTTALNMQMKINIESYLSKMETTGTLVFATEEVYTYDAASTDMDEYESLNTEKIISDNLFDICMMENFVDFGIVYSNNHVVGKVSNGTLKLFGDRLYDDLSAMITRQRTHDGWSTGYNNDFKRIYYVKRINDGAVLVTSFYTTELETVFEHPEEMIDMTVQLIDNNNAVIYSSDNEETGNRLSEEIEKRIDNRLSATIIDNEYLLTVSECGDSWYVICSIPTEIILAEKNEITFYIVIVGAAATIIAVILAVILAVSITNPMDNIVTTLDTKAHIDQLTGLLNKRSFEEFTENAFKNADASERFALIILDVDNFKGVNDTLGHAYGDKVLSGIGEIIKSVFSESDYKGRIGGDEFSVLARIPSEQFDDMNFIKFKCCDLCDAFHNNYTGDDGRYKISASIGVSLFSVHGQNFDKLYKCADKALYHSKKRGKDTYTIYDDKM
ncbi:MAG: GGDEF domain-containing protein [Porcipelethomonas sp.]